MTLVREVDATFKRWVFQMYLIHFLGQVRPFVLFLFRYTRVLERPVRGSKCLTMNDLTTDNEIFFPPRAYQNMPQIDDTRAARPASQSRILSALLIAERVTRWTMRRVAIAVKGMCSARDIVGVHLEAGSWRKIIMDIYQMLSRR